MFPSVLQRAIFRELLLVFLQALVVLIAIVAIVTLFEDRWQYCSELQSFLVVMQWLVPALLPKTVPAALLFATCQVYGRIRRDQEMLAIQAGGIHLRHVTVPALLLGLGLSGVVVVLYYTVIPSTEYHACEAIMKHSKSVLYMKLRSSGKVSLSPYTIYARQLQGEELVDPIIKHRDDNDSYDIVMHARRGEFLLDTGRRVLKLRLSEGGMLMTDTCTTFESFILNLPLPSSFGTYYPQRTSEMTLFEILSHRAKLLDRIHELEEDPPDTSEAEVDAERKSLIRDVRYMNVEIQKRPAIAVSCLCFVIAGCAAGLYSGMGDSLSAFVACFLPISLFHETAIFCGIHLAAMKGWPPELTLWWANATIGFCGLVLLRRVMRR
jgi:lipopolysaccharide export system permease protein